MWGTIKAIFTNTLGNTLAIVNLVLITMNLSGTFRLLGLDRLGDAFYFAVFFANIPARIASAIVSLITTYPRYGTGSNLNHYSLQELFFVYLQWVVIGAIASVIAKSIAIEIRARKELSERELTLARPSALPWEYDPVRTWTVGKV